MQPADIQLIGEMLAIRWEGGKETIIPMESLRRHCPCAGCRGERDIMGNLHKGSPEPLEPESFRILELSRVGSYALRPVWADGHSTGLFSFDYLQQLGEADRPHHDRTS